MILKYIAYIITRLARYVFLKIPFSIIWFSYALISGLLFIVFSPILILFEIKKVNIDWLYNINDKVKEWFKSNLKKYN